MFDWDIERADLLFQIKILRDQVRAFESGEKYIRMKEEFHRCRAADARATQKLKAELAAARIDTRHVRKLWYEVCEKQTKETDKLRKELDELREKYLKKCYELYEVKTELEEMKEKNDALQKRVRKDYSNSSIPSSMSPNHTVIHNSREKTGRNPGGQPGHEHHGRKQHKPTRTHVIEPPKKYQNAKNYRPTGRTIKKQVVSVHVVTEVIEYITPEYRNIKTGQRVHAPFPEGVVNDVTYDGSVKAFAYMLNNELYTSVDKTRSFLKDISHGEIDVSNGFICKLSEEFSQKTKKERDEIFLKLVAAPVLHSDFTFGRVNGKQASVIITATDDAVLYQERPKKGDEGVKGSPVEIYEGTLVSDHEAALKKHGKQHQECLAHILRYAKSGMENETEKKWHKRLIGWIDNAIGYWNEVQNDPDIYVSETANEYIERLSGILDMAKEEYAYDPPSRYYRDGYNTYRRMRDDFDDYVLFLRDPSVPPTNNLAERHARKIKRKTHQVISFRSENGFEKFCDGKTIIESARAKGDNLYDALVERFNQSPDMR